MNPNLFLLLPQMATLSFKYFQSLLSLIHLIHIGNFNYLVSDLVLGNFYSAQWHSDAVLCAVAGGEDPSAVDEGPSALLVDAGTTDLNMGSPRKLKKNQIRLASHKQKNHHEIFLLEQAKFA